MVLDQSKLSVLHAPLQPLTKEGDSTHPTGYRRDGYCWGDEQDPGNHFIGAVVSQEFLEYSKQQGNDLMTQRPGFPGLKDGCKWCLCVNRWKEAMMASDKLGEKVVPRVDLSATALPALKGVSLEDLKKYEFKSTKPVIAVAFYSTYGHIASLAEEVIKGVEASGATVRPYVIKETLPQEVLAKMYADTSIQSRYPAITPHDLKEVDGLILGAPTRYGRLPSQVDAFFDQTGGLWAAGALTGKFVSMFTSAAGQHSGHESTALTTYPFVAHHGMVYVPIGYANQKVGSIDTVQGSSPYGVSTVAGSDGSRKPTEVDLEVAQFQGKFFGDFVSTFVKGKHAATAATSSHAVVPATAAAGTAAAAATTTTAATSSHKEAPALAPPLDTGIGLGGYTVDSTPGETATATPVEKKETAIDSVADKPTAKAAVAETEEPAAATPAPVTKETETAHAKPAVAPSAAGAKEATPAGAAANTPAVAPAPVKKDAPKKKKGFFASCCGDSGIDK
ncbi:NAD(P)H:quinone oxidoreductase, type IV [Kwoniella sp. DSM 27419]